MTRAWIVIERVAHEGDELVGVYSTAAAAEQHAQSTPTIPGAYFVVQEWEVDGARVSSTDVEWGSPEPDVSEEVRS
jgi:hypothetical protein